MLIDSRTTAYSYFSIPIIGDDLLKVYSYFLK